MAFVPVNIRGKWTHNNPGSTETPAKGYLVWYRNADLQDADNLATSPADKHKVRLNASGVISIYVEANDSPNCSPANTTYTFEEHINGYSRKPYKIQALVADAASGIELATRAPVSSGPVVLTYALASALSAEITRATDAEADLQGQIDDEASARALVDTDLQSNIDAEATTRANADTTLQTNITAEASARATADTTLQSNIDAKPNTFLELTDTPDDYTGHAGEAVIVNVTEDGTEFGTVSGGASLYDNTPLIESGSGDAGDGTEASRDDHVHPAVDLSGYATASALSTEVTNRTNADTTITGNLNTHTARTDNPHSVTAAQTGALTQAAGDTRYTQRSNNLSDVANAGTSRTNLGLGTAATKDTGTSSGQVPLLDGSGKLATAILPALSITETFTAASQVAMLALSAQQGDVAVRTDLNKSFILAGTDPTILANWQELLTPTDAVLSVAGRTGAVTLANTDISGLGTASTHAHGDYDAAGTASAAITTHVGLSDPHTQYLTQTEADALYASVGSGIENPMTETGDLMTFAFGAQGTDYGPTATPVQSANGNHPDQAFDGELTLAWDSGSDNIGSGNAWLGVDLGADQTIQVFRVVQWADISHNADHYDIEYSANGSSWTLALSEDTTGDGPDVISTLPSPITARYFRVRAISGPTNTDSFYIFILEVRGVPTGDVVRQPKADADGLVLASDSGSDTGLVWADPEADLGLATSSDLSTHEALTTTAHGGIVASSDARLTDARTPTAHATSHVTGGSDVIANVVAAGNSGLMTGADKTKLNGIATGATANQTDAYLLDRTHHTGTQAASTISDFSEAVDDRVAALLVQGANVTLTYDDTANTLTVAASGGGSTSFVSQTKWSVD